MATQNKGMALVCAALAVSSALLAPTAQAQGVSFIARRDFDAGRGPRCVAVGDFNGDGVPDLAVANGASNNVAVLLGNEDGTFQTPRNFPAGSLPYSVAVGDFNGDGLQDLALANSFSATVSVLLGNGDGTFRAPRSFPAGSFQAAWKLALGTFPASVVVGDFNGDGLQDLAVTNGASNSV